MELDIDLRDLAVAAGVFLQLVALVVVIFQLRRVNTSIRVSAQAALYQQSAGIRSLLVEHPEPRPYLVDGGRLPTTTGTTLACGPWPR